MTAVSVERLHSDSFNVSMTTCSYQEVFLSTSERVIQGLLLVNQSQKIKMTNKVKLQRLIDSLN